MIVLRYRFHPAWWSAGGQPVLRYPVPEDIGGFIALRDPGRNVTLHFDPAAMLRAFWPDPIPNTQSEFIASPPPGADPPLHAK
jgi:hypothetical protein